MIGGCGGGSGSASGSTLSPQRITYYRDNWYLEAWCHQRNDYRIFLLAGFKQVNCLEEKTKLITPKKLNQLLCCYLVNWKSLLRNVCRKRWRSISKAADFSCYKSYLTKVLIYLIKVFRFLFKVWRETGAQWKSNLRGRRDFKLISLTNYTLYTSAFYTDFIPNLFLLFILKSLRPL